MFFVAVIQNLSKLFKNLVMYNSCLYAMHETVCVGTSMLVTYNGRVGAGCSCEFTYGLVLGVSCEFDVEVTKCFYVMLEVC